MAAAAAADRSPSPLVVDEKSERSLMMRVLGPVTTFVNRPWKVRTPDPNLRRDDGNLPI